METIHLVLNLKVLRNLLQTQVTKFAIIVVFICFPIKNWACSCVGENSIKDSFKKSDVIFSGTVISKKQFNIDDINLPKGFPLTRIEYSVLVETVYKGKLKNDTIRILTGVGNGDCGIQFLLGSKYILYSKYSKKYFEKGHKVKKFLYTDICDRTRVLESSETLELEKMKKDS